MIEGLSVEENMLYEFAVIIIPILLVFLWFELGLMVYTIKHWDELFK